MVTVKKYGILLQKTSNSFENEAVLNPAAIREQEYVHLFYRAVSKGNYSSIGYCKMKGPFTVEERLEAPIIFPEYEYEKHGIEDPRIVKIDDLYYLTYTAFDGVNALGALAVSTDLLNWEKKGIIVPQITYQEFSDIAEINGAISEKYLRYNGNIHILADNGKEMLLWDKNVIFFPRRIDGKLMFLHRIKPDVQILVSILSLDELTPDFWHNYFLQFKKSIVLTPRYEHEVSYVGGGCPPIETAQGWLIIYHGVHDSLKGFVYSACAALLDLENPTIEIARLPYPLFYPEFKWELKGEVNNVCFPSGAVVYDDMLYIYYGAADEQIAYASVKISELLTELMLNTTNNAK
jgi:predicted GH43/DUF377 family glycosyl hydrolase